MTEQSKQMVEEAKRVSQKYQDEAKKMGQEYQHQAERVGQQFQKAAETGVGSILQSWGELNRGWTAMAAEVNEYSKTVFNDATRTMEQLVGAKTFEDVVEIQSTYAKKAYDNHIAEVSKLGKMCSTLVGNAYKQTTDRA
jgi:hypothetical protein